MKKWKKWTLGIVGFVLIALLILVATMWSTISIIKGTEELSGETETIPRIASTELEPLVKGNDDWPSWLGVNGDNRSKVSGIIKDWSGGLKKLWEVNFLCQGNLSATWSAPVIQGNRLIVSGRDEENDLIFCLNPEDGRLLWQASYGAESESSHGTGPRATPSIDDDRVYTYGRSGDLVCWSLLDGRELWRKNVVDQGGDLPTWGHASSPLILSNTVIVQGGGIVRTIAYQKMTGEVAWTSGDSIAGYAALTTMDIAGQPVLLTFHGKGLAAIDVVDGAELWDVPWETRYDVNATTPVVIGDRVFITSGYGTGCELLKTTRTEAKVLWVNKTIASTHSDPYVLDGYIYGYSGHSFQNWGAFKCVDLKNGIEKWATNKMGWGTCVFVDGHLLCCDIKGNLFLMKPDPNEFNMVTQLPHALGDILGPVWTKPIIANGLLYLRFKQRLVCYDLIKKNL